jgi:hypothetical protein
LWYNLFLEERVKKVLGIGMIVLALVMAVAPVFTDCLSQGRQLTTQDGRNVPMKCHWSGIAEIGAAVPLALAGVFTLASRRRETLRLAAVLGVASGALAILFPTALIGVCGSASMVCNLLMKPILLGTGILAIAASVVLFFLAREQQATLTPAAAA